MSLMSSKFKSGDDFKSFDPRMQRIADFKRIKEILALTQFVTTLWSRFFLLATFALRG